MLYLLHMLGLAISRGTYVLPTKICPPVILSVYALWSCKQPTLVVVVAIAPQLVKFALLLLLRQLLPWAWRSLPRRDVTGSMAKCDPDCLWLHNHRLATITAQFRSAQHNSAEAECLGLEPSPMWLSPFHTRAYKHLQSVDYTACHCYNNIFTEQMNRVARQNVAEQSVVYGGIS